MYEDEMIRAIRRRFAPDIMTTLRDASVTEFSAPLNRVTLPLMASTKLLYDKDLAAFQVDGSVKDVDSDNCLMARQYFSSMEIRDAKDKAAIINYLFDGLKHMFTDAIVNKELDKLLGVKADGK